MTKLQKEISDMRTKLRILVTRQEEIEDQKIIPGLKKRYERKYFVFHNSNGSDKRWDVHIKVLEITGTSICSILSFEKNESDEIKINTGTYFISMLEVEITKQKFENELKKLKTCIDHWTSK